MAEYIDREWVRAHVKPYYPDDEKWVVTGGTAIRLIHNAIDNAPVADVVEVVRCRDCESAEESDNHEYVICCNLGVGMAKDDFCSQGVRKDV